MNGHSLTQLTHVMSKNRSDKSLEMNEKHRANTFEGKDRDPGLGGAARPSDPRPIEPLGGKDHTAPPAASPKARVFVDDGSRPTVITAPGSTKTPISEELTRKSRPRATVDPALEKHVGNGPRSVGISLHSMEAEL